MGARAPLVCLVGLGQQMGKDSWSEARWCQFCPEVSRSGAVLLIQPSVRERWIADYPQLFLRFEGAR